MTREERIERIALELLVRWDAADKISGTGWSRHDVEAAIRRAVVLVDAVDAMATPPFLTDEGRAFFEGLRKERGR